MVPVQTHFPDVVYHYTSMDTLLKIVESGSVWATNIRYLNDVLERRHCLDEVRRFMSAPPHGRDRAKLLSLLDENEENEKAFSYLPFVASFSEERDSLSQWRSYCPGGNGVSIGFRTESLLKGFVGDPKEAGNPSDGKPKRKVIYLPPTVSFGPVEYLGKDNRAQIDQLLTRAMIEAEKMEINQRDADDSWGESDEWDEDDLLYRAIDKYASMTKHFSFASENEYRLLATTMGGNDKSIKYRSSSSTLIPYIPIGVPNPKKLLTDPEGRQNVLLRSSSLTPYFISSVTIGPTPHLELSADALRAFFLGRRLGVEIRESIVPFRSL